jgi:hypothetical protein
MISLKVCCFFPMAHKAGARLGTMSFDIVGSTQRMLDGDGLVRCVVRRYQEEREPSVNILGCRNIVSAGRNRSLALR